MKIEQIRIQNYRVFRDCSVRELPSAAFFVGENGSGKSTLFDVFAFLRDSLKDSVHVALQKRGGFKEVVSRGHEGPIVIELKLRDSGGPLVTYRLEVGEEKGRGVVRREVLKYRRGSHGQPWHFLDFRMGSGQAIINESDFDDDQSKIEREEQELDGAESLAIKGLGQFQRFKVVSSFRRLIERWHFSDIHISEARPSQEAGYAEHLTARGDNLALVTQYLYENHRDRFDEILSRITRRVPGVDKVEATETVDGRLVLRFSDGSFKDPFIARHVSDGTIKMFAYLVLLSDPTPHPLLCVEEPENQLYPMLLLELVEEFRAYGGQGGQVMISTHSPDLLNAARGPEVYLLRKNSGFTTITRAADDPQVVALVNEGDQLGALWKQGLLSGATP